MLYHSVHLAMAADLIKKILLSLVSVVLIAGAGIYLFKAPLWEMAQEKLTADMFVSAAPPIRYAAMLKSAVGGTPDVVHVGIVDPQRLPRTRIDGRHLV